MFGKNEIVGQSYFKDAASDELFVTSAFMTLQGEGPLSGLPAFFIRLAKCQLACSFCDTFFDDGDWLTFDHIFEKTIENGITEYFNGDVPEYAKGDQKNMVLVLTGGEPTLQKNIGPFLERANKIFKYTQIESNGILYQETIPSDTVLVVSPKCVEKKGKAVKYIKPNLQTLKNATCLKFVMSADQDSPYSNIPDWALNWKEETGRDIYVSPMNIYNDVPKASKEMRASGKNRIELEERSRVDEVISFWTPGLLDLSENEKNHKHAAEYCIRHGLKMQVQVHLYAGLA